MAMPATMSALQHQAFRWLATCPTSQVAFPRVGSISCGAGGREAHRLGEAKSVPSSASTPAPAKHLLDLLDRLADSATASEREAQLSAKGKLFLPRKWDGSKRRQDDAARSPAPASPERRTVEKTRGRPLPAVTGLPKEEEARAARGRKAQPEQGQGEAPRRSTPLRGAGRQLGAGTGGENGERGLAGSQWTQRRGERSPESPSKGPRQQPPGEPPTAWQREGARAGGRAAEPRGRSPSQTASQGGAPGPARPGRPGQARSAAAQSASAQSGPTAPAVAPSPPGGYFPFHDFVHSYSETPKIPPVGFREPAFSPFGPDSLAERPWTGGAPLRRGGKGRQSPAVALHKGSLSPREGEGEGGEPGGNTLGAPLSDAEVEALVLHCNRERRQVNLGRDGLVHNMLELVHSHWRRRPVCKLRCKGVPTVDMDNVVRTVEERTGGAVIRRAGGVLYVFRGRHYDWRTRAPIPLMLWKPPAPIYPKLIQDAPPGLTREEANLLRIWGRRAPAVRRLTKNGVYLDLVQTVRDTLHIHPFCKLDCRDLDKSDFKKIGAKLRDLVPCVLLSFERDHILMWRDHPERRPHLETAVAAVYGGGPQGEGGTPQGEGGEGSRGLRAVEVPAVALELANARAAEYVRQEQEQEQEKEQEQEQEGGLGRGSPGAQGHGEGEEGSMEGSQESGSASWTGEEKECQDDSFELV